MSLDRVDRRTVLRGLGDYGFGARVDGTGTLAVERFAVRR